MDKTKTKKLDSEKILLKFLKQTKEGEYAEIEESSMPYTRFPEQREEIFCEEEYYYNMR